jgi:hypothetical protein
MGEVVQLSEYRAAHAKESAAPSTDALIPIEFAVGLRDRDECLGKIAEYGVRAIHIRWVNEEPEVLLYLMGARDAIWLNKKILEREEISDLEIAQRIDLIQMLENMNLPMMGSMWESFTRQGKLSNS